VDRVVNADAAEAFDAKLTLVHSSGIVSTTSEQTTVEVAVGSTVTVASVVVGCVMVSTDDAAPAVAVAVAVVAAPAWHSCGRATSWTESCSELAAYSSAPPLMLSLGYR
jgi:hypothetical protein